jgi:hypothetical protein
VDVRFLSGRQAVAAYLEGSRLGTVDLNRGQLDTLELEAKVYGLTQAGRRGDLESKRRLGTEDESAIFDFFSKKRNYRGKAGLPNPKNIRKSSGRKRYATDTKPREMSEAILQNLTRKEPENAPGSDAATDTSAGESISPETRVDDANTDSSTASSPGAERPDSLSGLVPPGV